MITNRTLTLFAKCTLLGKLPALVSYKKKKNRKYFSKENLESFVVLSRTNSHLCSSWSGKALARNVTEENFRFPRPDARKEESKVYDYFNASCCFLVDSVILFLPRPVYFSRCASYRRKMETEKPRI